LRTHAELGYRQEQRFHLELGLLKMAHAQRLLPIEQLLSEVSVEHGSTRAAGRPSVVAKPEPTVARSNVSPFAADSARKSKPQMAAEEHEDVLSRMPAAGTASTPVVMGSAAPAVAQAEPVHEMAPRPIDDVRNAVLNALASHRVLVSMLDTGEWSVEGGEVVIKVAQSATVIDMSISADARRLAMAAASGVMGRPMKLKVIPGLEKPLAAKSSPANGGGRGRAEQDPIVQRMKEKFGAEIRTIIDYKEKR
jgi:DNA polymerase III subunit gamma/tau